MKANDHTKPEDAEASAGAVAGIAWFICMAGGGGSVALTTGTPRVVIGVMFGVLWLVAGVWWLALFLRRTGRAYRSGLDDTA